MIIYFTSNTEHFANEKGKGPCTTKCIGNFSRFMNNTCVFYDGKYERCKRSKADIGKTGRKCVGFKKHMDKCPKID